MCEPSNDALWWRFMAALTGMWAVWLVVVVAHLTGRLGWFPHRVRFARRSRAREFF